MSIENRSVHVEDTTNIPVSQLDKPKYQLGSAKHLFSFFIDLTTHISGVFELWMHFGFGIANLQTTVSFALLPVAVMDRAACLQRHKFSQVSIESAVRNCVVSKILIGEYLGRTTTTTTVSTTTSTPMNQPHRCFIHLTFFEGSQKVGIRGLVSLSLSHSHSLFLRNSFLLS